MSAGRYNGGELTKALLKTFVAIMSHLNLIISPLTDTEAVCEAKLTSHLTALDTHMSVEISV